MRILLVGPDYEENLSIRYLSASLLAAGHETILAPFNSSDDIQSVAGQAEDADIVGLSMCFQSRASEFLSLARVIKSSNPKKTIVAGGHYASCAAEALLEHHPELDIVVIHEGEAALVEIADALPNLNQLVAEIPGIAYRDSQHVHFTSQRRTLDNLDALPFPDRRGPIHSIAGIPTSYMMGSRGCYGSCAYCCITTLHHLAPGKRFRQRSVTNVVDEMAALYHERGTRQFVFHDDNFLVPSASFNHSRICAFETALAKSGIKDVALVIKCRPADASRAVFERLKNLGLVRVFLGVESSTELGLSSLERAQTVEDSIRALELCAELDISAQCTLMIFNPDATLETLRADVAFMRRFAGNPLNFCRAEIYAGTPLEKRMIESGRARGDYRAREYDLTDPGGDLACALSLDLFSARCWAGGSVMQNTIGLDHMAAVVKRLSRHPQAAVLAQRVSAWVRSVNLDTIDLLDQVIDISSAGTLDAPSLRILGRIREREAATRTKFLTEAASLKRELEGLQFTGKPVQTSQSVGSHFRLARQAAVAVLALGMPAVSCQQGVSEMAPPPVKNNNVPQIPLGNSQDAASLNGTVTDASGAVVGGATITITYGETSQSRVLTTNDSGQYEAKELPAGHYMVTAIKQGFRSGAVTNIELKAGTAQRVDIRLEIGNFGCCEYAAAPLKVETEDYSAKHKPFTYTVGEAKDHGTLKGVANLVYGDPNMWIQIFEANRGVLDKPSVVPEDTLLVIPPRKREVPKLISKVAPVYPAAAMEQHLSGDVVMDVTLKDDGSVNQVSIIDGNPVLAESAVAAVKRWRYHPLVVKGKPILSLVVVVSFSKSGKVH